MRSLSTILISIVLFGFSHAGYASDVPIDRGTSPLQSNGEPLVIAGPQSMAYLLSFWLVEFKKEVPGLSTRIVPMDSASVADALIDGTAEMGAMSRAFTDEEIRAFRARHRRAPIALRVGLDAIAVYVHRDNPLRGLTVAQLDAIFSTTRRCGFQENIFWWDQLGLSGDWTLKQIELYGQDTRSGARMVFKKEALCGGDYKATLEMAPTRTQLLRVIASNRAAIAYSGLDTHTNGIRVMAIAPRDGTNYVVPNADTIREGNYPLSRTLYIYIQPQSRGSAIYQRFLRFTLSPRGQELVRLNGLVPLPSSAVSEELSKLQ